MNKETDREWLIRKIREEFDTPMEIYQIGRYEELIAMAERFGLFELAEQMRDDVRFPATA